MVISGSSAFSKPNLYTWKFLVHILLKPSLKDFEHYFASMWNECNCVVSLYILLHCPSLGLEWKLTFSSPVATAEFSKFANILSHTQWYGLLFINRCFKRKFLNQVNTHLIILDPGNFYAVFFLFKLAPSFSWIVIVVLKLKLRELLVIHSLLSPCSWWPWGYVCWGRPPRVGCAGAAGAGGVTRRGSVTLAARMGKTRRQQG